jgi:hypothetical protein
VRTSLLGAATWVAATLAATAASVSAASVARTAVIPAPRMAATPTVRTGPTGTASPSVITSPRSAPDPSPTPAPPVRSPLLGSPASTVIPSPAPPTTVRPSTRPAAVAITITGVGGSAAVRCTGGAAELVYATPASGFRFDAANTTATQIVFRDASWITALAVVCEDDTAYGKAIEMPAATASPRATSPPHDDDGGGHRHH